MASNAPPLRHLGQRSKSRIRLLLRLSRPTCPTMIFSVIFGVLGARHCLPPSTLDGERFPIQQTQSMSSFVPPRVESVSSDRPVKNLGSRSLAALSATWQGLFVFQPVGETWGSFF